MNTTVVPVRGRRLATRFLTMPFPLYRECPQWIPPLTYSARRFMNPRHNPYFRQAEIDHFLAVDDAGRAVGRICATVDPDYVARFGKTGFFGWLETVDDPGVAGALLHQAEDWARERGMAALAGPYSYNATQEFGLLVDGHATTPAVFQPHNPGYYADLLRGAGYRISFRTDTYRWTAPDDEPVMRAAVEHADAARRRYRLSVRTADPARWSAELDTAYRLFCASFADNHDMVPMSREMFDFEAAELKPFLDPRLITFVEHAGEPVGFSILIADANEVLAAARGRLSPGFLLRFRRLVRSVRGAVVLMVGALPSAAGMGVGRVLAGEIARVGLGHAGRYRTVHTTWIHEHNWQSRALVRRTGAVPYRRYAVFEKALTG